MKLTYDEKSPITGNLCVLTEQHFGGITIKVCTESNFYTCCDRWHFSLGFSRGLGFNNAIDQFTYGLDVADPFARRPTRFLQDAFLDDDGFIWLPLTQRINRGDVVHYATDIDQSVDELWGVSPVIYLADAGCTDEQAKEDTNRILSYYLGEDTIQPHVYDHPKFMLVDIEYDHHLPMQRPIFADLSKTKWFASYDQLQQHLKSSE